MVTCDSIHFDFQPVTVIDDVNLMMHSTHWDLFCLSLMLVPLMLTAIEP